MLVLGASIAVVMYMYDACGTVTTRIMVNLPASEPRSSSLRTVAPANSNVKSASHHQHSRMCKALAL